MAANAYVGPQVSTYIRRLDNDLKRQGFGGSLFMMGSNGGLLSTERTCRQPIGLVESGPIGGCIGASAYAEKLGFKNVVAFDMGGTTAKCALVENGRFSVNSLYYANGYVKGFPIKSAVIDIVEVGSGGGSIAWIDSQKRLHVGPQSAGSTRVRCVMAAAARSRRLPMRIWFLAGSIREIFSAAKCNST